MSTSTKQIVGTVFQCCSRFWSFCRRSNVGNAAITSSLGVRGRRYRLALNIRGIVCLSRLLFNRAVANRSLTASVWLVVNQGLDFKWKQLSAKLSFSGNQHSQQPRRGNSGRPGELPDKDNDGQQPLRLMDYRQVVWPRPWKSIRNYLFSFMISSYFDDKFSIDNFLDGAQQAITMVAGFISKGQFEALEGLVAREAIQEVRQHYMQLSEKQRDFVAVNADDFFTKFVYEIGMIFDDDTNQRFVEITTVFQGYHGYATMWNSKNVPELMEQMYKTPDRLYVCNYRFIREFTKGKQDDWTVNKLNHFVPSER